METSDQLNIPSTVSDPHYRYKMPKIQTAIQGSGNGIKTKWTNLPEVSKALKVPTEYPLKFIGRELGSNIEIKANSYLINGNHQIDKMQEILDKFIKKYVLCPKCKLPEIHGKIQVTKDKKEIKCKCRSCGAVSKLDSTHEFATYIQRHPPPYDKDNTPSSGSTEKEVKKTLDKNTRKSIKECCEKIPNVINLNNDINDNCNNVKNLINQYNFPIDIKFYVLANGIFDQNLYTKAFQMKIPLIKFFIFNESDNKNDEALFFFLVGLADFIFARKNEKCGQYISSILYYFYNNDILSEDFWKSVLENKEQIKYKSLLFNQDIISKFLKSAEDFSEWIKNGPYEGDEDKNNEEKKEEKKEDEDIDIDNI